MIAGTCFLAWLALVLRMAPRVPIEAALSGDTESYIAIASYRPPLYGWVLAAYQWATGGYDYLPLFQFLLTALALLIFSVELGRLLRSLWVGPLSILLVLMHVAIYDSPRLIMSEALFVAMILAGLGLQFRYTRLDSLGDLLGAAIFFALAAVTRTTGMAFLLIPMLCAMLDRRRGYWGGGLRACCAMLATGLVLIMAMAGNHAKHGRFEIGSWTGMAVLGKGLLLLDESDVPVLPPPASAAAPEAARLRVLVDAQPNIADRMRAQMQASEDLRFALFFPAAEENWPDWQIADWRERGALALTVGSRLIERHPLGFLQVWARDWGSLVLYPMHWPAWASTEPPDKLLFPACRLHDNCWALTRYDIPAPALAVMLAVSLTGAIGGVLLLLGASGRVLRRRALPTTILFWAMTLVLHTSLLVSAAFESGLVRYTVGLHVLGAALLLWFLHVAWGHCQEWFRIGQFRMWREGRPALIANNVDCPPIQDYVRR